MDAAHFLTQQAGLLQQSIVLDAVVPTPTSPPTLTATTPVESDQPTLWSSSMTPSLVGQGDPLGPTDNGPRNYTRPDAFILDDIAKALAWDPTVNAFDLDVTCTDGHVHISGTVPLSSSRKQLEVLVASVLGVRELSIQDVVVSKGIEPVEQREDMRDE